MCQTTIGRFARLARNIISDHSYRVYAFSLFFFTLCLTILVVLLAIDIGNSHITLGIWDGQQWLEQWRLRTMPKKTADEYWIDIRALLHEKQLHNAIKQVIFSTVVPSLSTPFIQLSQRYLQLDPIQVTHETNSGVTIVTDQPAEVGADRIVNTAAVSALYDGAAIVIDMGTATTFDLVSAEAELLGVVIAPGMRLAADALTQRAAQLGHVALEAPPTVLGKNTIHSVQSGLVYGYVCLIEGIIARLTAEYLAMPGRTDRPCVIGTGGLISTIAPLTEYVHHVDPLLTLNGLRIISNRARK